MVDPAEKLVWISKDILKYLITVCFVFISFLAKKIYLILMFVILFNLSSQNSILFIGRTIYCTRY